MSETLISFILSYTFITGLSSMIYWENDLVHVFWKQWRQTRVYKLHLCNRDLKYSNATYAYTLYERLPLRYQRSIYYVVTWAPLYQSTASPTKVDQESIEERIWTTSRINNGISINNILSVLIPIHGSGWLMVMLCYILAFTVILLLPLVADTLATAQQNVTELNISHR